VLLDDVNGNMPVPERVLIAGAQAHLFESYPEAFQRRNMAKHIKDPTVIKAQGSKPKSIEEFIGRVNTGTSDVSVALMKSPAGWIEPGQTPEFDEYTLVLRGLLRVRTKDGTMDVKAGESVIAETGEWIQYSTPSKGGAQYIAVCMPAFSSETVHRDRDESLESLPVVRRKARPGRRQSNGKRSKSTVARKR
jgi:mannose-6-phosphate isomerase-like protein (cupin superfamily)